ncbi:MAG: SIMPL domain-containing protein [Porphyrobacter sp.]|nr:SIMPL domain-containing protein [Porphyrobacter sp.]
MKHYVLPALASAALAMPAEAQVQVTSSGPVVELTVSESVQVAPDIATVSAGVTTQAPTASEAMRANAQTMTAVVARIKQLGIPERDIQTTGINLGQQFDFDRDTQRQVFRGFQVSNRVSVKLRDVARTGEVLDALVAAGATDIGGPDFSVDDDTAARAQARQTAMATARTLALDYARGAGFADVRLLQVREGISQQPPMPMFRMQAQDVSAASTPVQPGMVQSGVSVTVTYELTR